MSVHAGQREIPEITIGLMGLEDLPQVMEIERRSYLTPWSRGAFVSELMERERARYIVARLDGRVVGYAGMWLILDEAHVTNIAVHPEYRNQRIGHRLLKAVEEHSEARGIKEITLEVRASNEPAKRLYRNHGFVPTGVRPGYYRDTDEDAIIMTKRFQDPGDFRG